MPSTWWTEDRTETLRKLWAAGVSFSNIAAQIGGVTRSAVGGKLYRLDLVGRDTNPRTYSQRTPEQIEAAKRAKSDRRNERRRTQRVSFVMVKRVNLEALRCIEVEPMHKSFADLGPNDCRYPYGDGPYTFCGQQKFGDSSYCGGHMALSFRRNGS